MIPQQLSNVLDDQSMTWASLSGAVGSLSSLSLVLRARSRSVGDPDADPRGAGLINPAVHIPTTSDAFQLANS